MNFIRFSWKDSRDGSCWSGRLVRSKLTLRQPRPGLSAARLSGVTKPSVFGGRGCRISPEVPLWACAWCIKLYAEYGNCAGATKSWIASMESFRLPRTHKMRPSPRFILKSSSNLPESRGAAASDLIGPFRNLR